MSFVFGIDEAGYGPRLGPLVIAASGWKLSGNSGEFDFWSELSNAVCQTQAHDERIHVADSKVVYSPAIGMANLERSVLTLLSIAGLRPGSFLELCRCLTNSDKLDGVLPSYLTEDDVAISLPREADPSDVDQVSRHVARAFHEQGVKPCWIRARIVDVERFNGLTDRFGSKGSTLTEASLGLVAGCCEPLTGQPALILADRHGGRRYYRGPLVEALGGQLVTCVSEQPDSSRYRARDWEFRFETGGERHFPVAVASMCAKYVRELAMEAFNRFWGRHVPGIRPTRGYPSDAGRFRQEISKAQQRLGIPDEHLWRIR